MNLKAIARRLAKLERDVASADAFDANEITDDEWAVLSCLTHVIRPRNGRPLDAEITDEELAEIEAELQRAGACAPPAVAPVQVSNLQPHQEPTDA